jgi:predicted lipid-binding transport protein (Tim44 family)
MDLSKLNSNERLAFWGAVLSIIGAILTIVGYAGGAGGLWLTFLLAIAMIVILFLPQWSPQTNLPGSKGTLMLIVGGVAALGSLLGLLGLLAFLGLLSIYAGFVLLPLLGLLLGIIGGFMMGWAGWREFQAEGGKFVLGTRGGSTTTAPPPAPPSAAQEAPPPAPAAPAQPTYQPPPAAPPPATTGTDTETDPDRERPA